MSQEHDIRLPYEQCIRMTVKQIRQTREYKLLTPFGILNKSGTYRYGNKSTMRKQELCKALDNPAEYHKKMRRLKDRKINASNRERGVRHPRTGNCTPKKRLPPCRTNAYPYEGRVKSRDESVRGDKCCYKKRRN